MIKKRKPKIIVRPLPGLIAGLACKADNTIEVDPDLWPRQRLEVIVHEALHLADWSMSEVKVNNRAKFITEVLWRQGYRKKR